MALGPATNHDHTLSCCLTYPQAQFPAQQILLPQLLQQARYGGVDRLQRDWILIVHTDSAALQSKLTCEMDHHRLCNRIIQ